MPLTKINKVDRILVIDDDVELCSLVGEYLEPEGFQIEAVHDGNRGLDRALNGDHLLIVLDVMLPGMNGFDLAKRLVELRPGTRVLVTSGYTGAPTTLREILDGGMAYLSKPYTPDVLAAKVRAVIDGPTNGHSPS